MQMRFDGRLGFHGGLVHEKNIVDGLNRELIEEINLNKKYHVTKNDYAFTHVNTSNKLCLHFYGKEVSVDDFKIIEKEALDAEDYGLEASIFLIYNNCLIKTKQLFKKFNYKLFCFIFFPKLVFLLTIKLYFLLM